jgi:phosphonate transport system permease protein
MNTRAGTVSRLYRDRPRRPFISRSVAVLVLIVVASWLAGDFQPSRLLSARQQANAGRFLSELQPWPLQQADAPLGTSARWQLAADWFGGMWEQKGFEAVLATLAISLLAILLAGLWGAMLSLPATRTFANPDPFLAAGQAPAWGRRFAWRAVFLLTRAGLTVVRALPEFVWAFLWLALLGPSVWPMILALALHNTGILGKLTAEVVENTDTRAPAALRGLGAGRLPIVVAALVPLTLPRFLLYFFYRWETCVREATVLGMLGMASLGFWIVEARARNTYDEMLFFIICGMSLVLLGDLVSAVVRRFLRRA